MDNTHNNIDNIDYIINNDKPISIIIDKYYDLTDDDIKYLSIESVDDKKQDYVLSDAIDNVSTDTSYTYQEFDELSDSSDIYSSSEDTDENTSIFPQTTAHMVFNIDKENKNKDIYYKNNILYISTSDSFENYMYNSIYQKKEEGRKNKKKVVTASALTTTLFIIGGFWLSKMFV